MVAIHLQATSEYTRVPTSPEEEIVIKTKTYKRRWIVLFTFVFLSTLNNFMQYSFSPVADIAVEYYSVTPLQLNFLALVFMASGFTTRFLAMWIIDNRGLGIGVFISAFANCLGGWMRFYPGSHSFAWVLTGQSICAFAQSFIDIASPKLAANWFPPKQRAIATSLGQGPIFFSVLLGYTLTPHLIQKGSDIPFFLLLQASASTLALLLILVIFRDAPPMPPSLSAATSRLKFFESIPLLLKQRNFYLMFVTFSVAGGIAATLCVLMSELVTPSGYSDTEAGNIASIWISSAIIFGALGGPLIDFTHAYKRVMIFSISLEMISMALFAFALTFFPKNYLLLCFIVVPMGIGGSAAVAMIEATVETTYPIPEATSMGLLFLGLNVSGIIFVLGLQKLLELTKHVLLPLLLMVGICAIALISVFFFKNDYKRLEYERTMKKQANFGSATSLD